MNVCFGRASSPEEVRTKPQKMFLFVNMMGKRAYVPIYLNARDTVAVDDHNYLNLSGFCCSKYRLFNEVVSERFVKSLVT